MCPIQTRRSKFWLCLALIFAFHGAAFADDSAGQPAKPENAKTLGGMQVTASTIPAPAAPTTEPTMFVFGFFTTSVSRLNSLSNSKTYAYANTDVTVDPRKDNSGCEGRTIHPIVMGKGAETDVYPLFQVPGEMGLKYVLFYNTAAKLSHWTSSLDYSLDFSCSDVPENPTGKCNNTVAWRPDGSTIKFSGGQGAATYLELTGNGLATLTKDSSSGNYTLQDEDGTSKIFDPNGTLIAIKDASGVGWSISRTSSQTIVADAGGRTFTVTYGPVTQATINGQNVNGQVVTVSDPAGNAYTINYGGLYSANASINDVAAISFPGTPATVVSFKYLSFAAPPYSDVMSEVDYNGNPYLHFSYITASTDPHYEWANGSTLGDGRGSESLTYTTDSAGNVQAALINALGHQTTQTYDGTNGSGGAYNGQLSLISDNAVATCGATTHGRSYDANSNLSEQIDNNNNVHTYNYAANGQLQTETEAYGTSIARTTDYVWDPNQQLNRALSVTIEGLKKTSYTYNAQNRLSSVSVSNLSANGSANQALTTTYSYTLYGNGLVQTMTVTNPSPGGSNIDTYSYDALGNLTSLSNGLGQTTTYSNYNALGEVGHVVGPNGDATDYTYDARGRIATKTTYPNGSAASWTYAYDGFGLLYTLTGPDGQVTTWNRDPSTMWINTITHNDKDGSSTESFSYDANGDVIEHKVVRGSTVGLDEVFHYDALGRVYQKIGQNGQSLTYAYDGNGNTLSVTDATGHAISYQYDALNRVTQTTESGGASPSMPTSAPAINVPSGSTSGAYTVSWNSITGATYYVLQEQVNGGAWSTVQNSSAISWSPSGKTTNTYGYRVQACNVTGCGPWSGVGTINVAIPTAPTSAPSLTVPGNSTNGSYTVSWTSVTSTSTYNLQEQVNGGSWSVVQNNTSLSWSVSGKASATYDYRVQACNAIGCGPWSNTGSMVVTLPPVPATPATPSTPANNATGSYTVSWPAVSGAATYNLLGVFNGNWVGLQNGSATSYAASGQGNGTYTYAVQACNISGCSAYSSGATTVVTIPVPIAINGQTYNVSVAEVQGNTGAGSIGFDIVSGATWEVFTTRPGVGNGHVVAVNGAVPSGASTVQYAWTDLGVPSGAQDSAGSITNPAGSPVAISGNPLTQYTTATFSYKTNLRGHTYQLKVDFFNGSGINISSSVCTLTALVAGSQ